MKEKMADKIEAASKKKRSRSKTRKPSKKFLGSQDGRVLENLSSGTSSGQDSEKCSINNLTNSTIKLINSIDLSEFSDLGINLPMLKPRKATKKALEQVAALSRKAHQIHNLRELTTNAMAKNSQETENVDLKNNTPNATNQISENESQGCKNEKLSSSNGILKSRSNVSRTESNISKKENIASASSTKTIVRELSLKLDQLRELTASKSSSIYPEDSLSDGNPVQQQTSQNKTSFDGSDLVQTTKNVRQILKENAKIINHPLANSSFKNIEGKEEIIHVTYPAEEEDDETLKADISDNISNKESNIENNRDDNLYTLGTNPQTVAWVMEQSSPIQKQALSSKTFKEGVAYHRASSKDSQRSRRSEKIDPDTFLQQMPEVTRDDSYTSVVTKFHMAKNQIVHIIDQIKNKTLVYVDDNEPLSSCPPSPPMQEQITEIEQCKSTLERIRSMRKSIEAEKKKIEQYAQEMKLKKEIKERSKRIESVPRSETNSRSSSKHYPVESKELVREKRYKSTIKKKKTDKQQSVLELYKAHDYDSCMDLLDKLLNVKQALFPVLNEIQQETSKLHPQIKKKPKGPICSVSKANFVKASEASRFFQTLGKGEQKYDIPPYLTEMIVNNLCYADCFGKSELPEQDRVYVDADTLRQLLNFYEILGDLIVKLQEADNMICNKGCTENCPGPQQCGGAVCGQYRDEIEAIAAASENAKSTTRRQLCTTNRISAFFTHT